MRVISGRARGTKLKSIDSDKTRPTLDRVKESLFNILQDWEEAEVLDLFAGSGVLKENLEKTRFSSQAIILNVDFQKGLQELQGKEFDYIFLDPPYQTDYVQKALQEIRQITTPKRKWNDCSGNR